MSRTLCFLALLAICVPAAFATSGVDVSQPVSTSNWQCMRSNDGVSFAIVRTFQSTGSNDPNGHTTVANAWAAGLAHVDVYMFPCFSCGNPAGQVSSAVSYLKNYGTKFGQFWFDIEGTQYWGSSSSNQAFFSSMVSEGRSLGLNMGVYTSASQWDPIMGSGYTGGSSLPLWYAHYDNNPSFSDFSPFGGWTKPNMKQYAGDVTMCGVGVDKDWYP